MHVFSFIPFFFRLNFFARVFRIGQDYAAKFGLCNGEKNNIWILNLGSTCKTAAQSKTVFFRSFFFQWQFLSLILSFLLYLVSLIYQATAVNQVKN